MIILRFPFEHYKGESRLSFILWLIYPHHWDMILLRTLSNALCISRPLLSGWWECELFPAPCELWELFSLPLSDAFFDIYVEFHSLHVISTQPDLRRPLCRFLELSLSLRAVSSSPVLCPTNYRIPGLSELGSLYPQLSLTAGFFLVPFLAP